MHPKEQYALNLLRGGASGNVPKEGAPEHLVTVVRIGTQGRRYLSTALADLLAVDLTGDTNKALHESLSEREFQVFCKLGPDNSVSDRS
jgi:DNA-binding NarL/FixJ family response regulator